MADTKVSDMPAASALTGTDLVMVAQGGVSKKATGTQIQALAMPAIADQTMLGNVSGSIATPIALTATQVSQLTAGASSTWAARGSGSVAGETKRITDVGPTGGTRMMWDGTYWKAIAPTLLYFDTTLVAGIANTNEQILKQATLPAGILRAGRFFTIRALYAKDGTTDAATSIRIRIGTAGTTADTSVFSSNGLGTANRSLPTETWMFASSNVQLRVLSRQDGLTGWSGAAGGTYPLNITVSDIDANALIVSASTQMAGSTNLGQIPHLIVELVP